MIPGFLSDLIFLTFSFTLFEFGWAGRFVRVFFVLDSSPMTLMTLLLLLLLRRRRRAAFFGGSLFLFLFLSLFYKNSSKIWRLVKNKQKKGKKNISSSIILFVCSFVLFLLFSLSFFFFGLFVCFLSFVSRKREYECIVVVSHRRRHFFKTHRQIIIIVHHPSATGKQNAPARRDGVFRDDLDAGNVCERASSFERSSLSSSSSRSSSWSSSSRGGGECRQRELFHDYE